MKENIANQALDRMPDYDLSTLDTYIGFVRAHSRGLRKEQGRFAGYRMLEMLERGDIEGFMKRMQVYFADFPYILIPKNCQERHFQIIMYDVSKWLGARIEAEYLTSFGRIDMLVETDRYVYVFEFKLNGSLKRAMKQIIERGYINAFRYSGKRIFGIGVRYSTSTRNISSWQIRDFGV